MKSWPPLSPSSLCFLATRMWAVWLHPEIPMWCAFHYRPQTSSTKWPGTKTSETLSPDEPTVPLAELVVSSISYREASVCHTVVAESATALCPRTNFNQPEKKCRAMQRISQICLAAESLFPVLASASQLCLLGTDSPSTQRFRGFQILRRNDTTIICPWVGKVPEARDARRLRLLSEEGWQCWVPSIVG